MRYGSPKKNTARSRPCCKERLRSATGSSTPTNRTAFLLSLPSRTHPVRGYLYIAGATFLWGIAATLGRAAFTGRLLPPGMALRPIDPLILSQARTTFSLLVLLPILAGVRGWKNLKLPAADLGRCFLLGVLGVAASNYLYYFAIQKTNVATAIILQYTAPAWVLLY